MLLRDVLLIAFSFLCGSVPFAVLIGRLALRTNIRKYGDGNPGAFNVLRAGGVFWGALAIFLEMAKAALPVGLANYVLGVGDGTLVLVSIAAPLGHAYSPFLARRGGKAIAATGGVLIGLSLWELPLVAILMLIYWYSALTSSGWAVMFTIASSVLYVVLSGGPTVWIVIGALLTLLLAWRHTEELAIHPRLKISPLLRPVLARIFEQPKDAFSNDHP